MWSEIDRFIKAAEMHGLKSSPDHEVGDLQDMLRTAWEMLSPPARKVFYEKHAHVLDWLDEDEEDCNG